MKFTKLLLTILGCSIVLCGCIKNEDAIMKINDKTITKAEFYEDFNKLKELQLKNLPEKEQKSKQTLLYIKGKYVNDVIVRELLNQEFAKRNITASEEEIKAKIKDVTNKLGSKETFERLLKENSISQERLNSDMAQEVKLDKLVKSLGTKKISDKDAEKFYKENKAHYIYPERIQASHILFNTNLNEIKKQIMKEDKDNKLSQTQVEEKAKQQMEESLALAKKIREEAKRNPKNFASLAKKYSIDKVSAQNGGDLGYITKDSVVKEFGDVAFTQKVGTVSELVTSQYGTHIIYVKDKVAKKTASYNELKADIKTFLAKKQNFDALNKLIMGLKSSATIEFYDKSLDPRNIEKEFLGTLPKNIQKQTKKNK